MQTSKRIHTEIQNQEQVARVNKTTTDIQMRDNRWDWALLLHMSCIQMKVRLNLFHHSPTSHVWNHNTSPLSLILNILAQLCQRRKVPPAVVMGSVLPSQAAKPPNYSAFQVNQKRNITATPQSTHHLSRNLHLPNRNPNSRDSSMICPIRQSRGQSILKLHLSLGSLVRLPVLHHQTNPSFE